MIITVNCPRCRRLLEVPEGTEGRWLSCPKCLSSVPNPTVQRVTAEPPPAPPAANLCPSCGGDVKPGWRVCPACEMPLSAGQRQPLRSSLDADMRKDKSLTGGLLVGLGMLGGLVYTYVLCAGGFHSASPDTMLTVTMVVGFLLLLVVAVGIALSARSPHGGAATGVLGGMTIAGLIALMVVAFVLYSIFTCLDQTCGHHRSH